VGFYIILSTLVAPDAINNYVRTYKHHRRNMHFIAPEYGITTNTMLLLTQ